MKNILIIGYPKSGTTWISRLIGELLKAPVRGYWNAQHRDPASSGLDRQSSYCCYKSHMSHRVFEAQQNIHKAVYIIRDPRDVVVSGAHFFHGVDPDSKPVIKLLTRFWNKSRLATKMKKRMTKAILKGDKSLNPAMGMAWKEHVLPFVNDNNVLCLRYEDMLNSPLDSCTKVLEHIGLSRSQEEILEAVKAQSIESMRQAYKNDKNRLGNKLVRKGESGAWRTELNTEFIHTINSALESELNSLGYPMD